MSLENIMLSEKSQSQNNTYHLIQFIWNIKNSHYYRDSNLISDCSMLGVGKAQSFFLGYESVLKLVVVMVAQIYAYTKTTELGLCGIYLLYAICIKTFKIKLRTNYFLFR